MHGNPGCDPAGAFPAPQSFGPRVKKAHAHARTQLTRAHALICACRRRARARMLPHACMHVCVTLPHAIDIRSAGLGPVSVHGQHTHPATRRTRSWRTSARGHPSAGAPQWREIWCRMGQPQAPAAPWEVYTLATRSATCTGGPGHGSRWKPTPCQCPSSPTRTSALPAKRSWWYCPTSSSQPWPWREMQLGNTELWGRAASACIVNTGSGTVPLTRHGLPCWAG